MPWKIDDVDSHKKGLDAEQKKLWVKVANTEYESCLAKGGNDKTCAPKAIKIANKVVEGVSEKEWMSAEYQKKLGEKFMEKNMENTETKIEEIKATTEVLRDVIIPLDESEVKQPNIPLKIIQPGWGSSGYYSEQLLKNSAGMYKAGTLMFWDHPSESEEKDRPERSLRDLAGVLVTDGTYKEDGKAGPGIYALAKPFPEFRGTLEAIAPHIGVSHRAMGLAKQGEAEGRKGNVIEKLTHVESVDFVTQAGAGGQVVSLFESAKNGGAQTELNNKEEKRMELEKQLQEAQTKIKEGEDLLKVEKEAREAAEKKVQENSDKLAEISKKEMSDKVDGIKTAILAEVKDLPEAAKKRITAEPILTEDGSLDEEKVKEAINAKIVDERNYLAEVNGAGKVKGVGDTGEVDNKKSLRESFIAKYIREGKSKEQAERMADVAIK